ESGLEDVDERLQAVFIVRSQGEDTGRAIEVDLRGDSLEVISLRNLLRRLIDGVIHLLQVNGRGDVEGCVFCHVEIPPGREETPPLHRRATSGQRAVSDYSRAIYAAAQVVATQPRLLLEDLGARRRRELEDSLRQIHVHPKVLQLHTTDVVVG